MIRIDSNVSSFKPFVEALRGEHGTVEKSNGVKVLMLGRLVLFWGAFGDSAATVEIPPQPVRFPLFFAGDDSAAAIVVEPGKGFAEVPEAVKGKRFIVLGFAELNT